MQARFQNPFPILETLRCQNMGSMSSLSSQPLQQKHSIKPKDHMMNQSIISPNSQKHLKNKTNQMGRSRKWFKSVRTKLLLCTSHSTHPDETFVVFHTNEASNTPFSQEIVVPPKDQKNDPPTEEIVMPTTKDQQNNLPTEEIITVLTKDEQIKPHEEIVMPKDQQDEAPKDGDINSTMAPHAERNEIIMMSSKDHQTAAIKIQTSFRAHLARRAYKALKGLVKLQAVVRGMCVRRQVQLAMNCMNTLARLQITVRSHQLLTDGNFPSHASRPPSATQ